jgi:hypothetical protein
LVSPTGAPKGERDKGPEVAEEEDEDAAGKVQQPAARRHLHHLHGAVVLARQVPFEKERKKNTSEKPRMNRGPKRNTRTYICSGFRKFMADVPMAQMGRNVLSCT